MLKVHYPEVWSVSCSLIILESLPIKESVMKAAGSLFPIFFNTKIND